MQFWVVFVCCLNLYSFGSAGNTIYTVFGTGSGGTDGIGGPATSARLFNPRQVWQDSVGVVYVAGQDNCIRKFDTNTVDGIVYLVAGTCTSGGQGSFSGDNGPATSAEMSNTFGMAVDTAGKVYVSQLYIYRVRMVTPSGIISTFAGTGSSDVSGEGGQATSAGIGSVFGLWRNSVGTTYLGLYGSNIMKTISSTGIISLFAGTGTSGSSGDGGPATSATFNILTRGKGDITGVMYLSDYGNYVVQKVNLAGIVTRYAGNGVDAYLGENVPFTSQGIYYPADTQVDPSSGDVYVPSKFGNRVYVEKKTTGLVTTFAGTGVATNDGDGGDATSAGVSQPDALFLNTLSYMNIAQDSYHRVRSVVIANPTAAPSKAPSVNPSLLPTVLPSVAPSTPPSLLPSITPTVLPSVGPTLLPSMTPSLMPTVVPFATHHRTKCRMCLRLLQ